MRFDNVGLFWEDFPQTRGSRNVNRPMPPIPETGWSAPRDFPNLRNAPVISFDTETWDPELKKRGPGWGRKSGHIVGVSLAVPGHRWYFPVRHEVSPEENMDAETVFRYLRDTMAGNQPKIGANIIYDIGWLEEENITVNGQLHDVQYAEALLNESATVGLDDLAARYLGLSKETSVLYQWCSDFYGGSLHDQRKNIYRSPPCLAGPYAEADASLPLDIFNHQYPELERQGLMRVYRMECDLIRLLVKMRKTGVNIDLPKAEETYSILGERMERQRKKLVDIAGFDVNVNAADSMAKLFNKIGVAYPTTTNKKNPRPSFTADFLEKLDHPVGKVIRGYRKLAKVRGTFIKSYLIESNIDGRVYCQFHALRGDGDGTRSGRYSSSTPNLQNIPSRDKILGPLIRGLFIPDDGHRYWRRYDYSQIEYRCLVHFATGPGAEEARQQYINDPDTDYHEWTLDLVAPWVGWDVSTPETRAPFRKPIKNINFGLIYGMGVPKLTKSLGLSREQGKKVFEAYHKGVPFAKSTMDAFSESAEREGFISTILGRRSRFDLWEPANRNYGEDRSIGLPFKQAIRTYGDVKRAYLHKSLNRGLQGSAADIMKYAMWKCFTDGVFDATGIPKLTVHDELDFSDPGGRDDAFREMQHVMETALPLNIPVRADGDIGPNWGNLVPLP